MRGRSRTVEGFQRHHDYSKESFVMYSKEKDYFKGWKRTKKVAWFLLWSDSNTGLTVKTLKVYFVNYLSR